MFKQDFRTVKSAHTREAILQAALALFREKGFDATTMRDIAARADSALGAAYYYFNSKDAIVQAYYEKVQAEHSQRLQEMRAAGAMPLKERLAAVMHSKLDIVQADRKLLGTIFRYSGEPSHPLSCLGPGTREVREQSMQVIADALEGESLPVDLKQLLTLGLWSLQMGLLVYFIYDSSPQQQRTRKLLNNALDLTMNLLTVARFPLLGFFRKKILASLEEADLLPRLNFAPASQAVEAQS